jgi:hypothetical protein
MTGFGFLKAVEKPVLYLDKLQKEDRIAVDNFTGQPPGRPVFFSLQSVSGMTPRQGTIQTIVPCLFYTMFKKE